MRSRHLAICGQIRLTLLLLTSLTAACGGGEEVDVSENYRCISPDGSCSNRPFVSLIFAPSLPIAQEDFDE